jgi:glycosyltransferase involved in cell wall biosynthesis
MAKNKFGFILPPGDRFTGASAVNRDIYNNIKDEIDIKTIVADTEEYYKIHFVGSLLNYFTNYRFSKDYEYVMGTSFATLPFIYDAKVIQHFHSVDTGSYDNVLTSISDQAPAEHKSMERWVDYFKEVFEEKLDGIENRKAISEATESVCAKLSKIILAVSPSVKEQIVRLFDVDPRKIKVILNGIPDYWFDRSPAKYSDKTAIMFPTRINYTTYTFLEKGQDRAFEILSDVDAPKYVFLNFGTMKKTAQERYREVIEEKTKSELVVGLNREQLQSKYKAGYIFLSTSRTEACQLTLIEAMASRSCPVTYPIGIAPTIIKNGYNGYIVNSTDEAIEKINLLISKPWLRKKIGENAYNTAKRSFTMQKMLDSYRLTIKEIIND